jgi:hypothetical protein
MNEEIKQYLEAMEARLAGRLDHAAEAFATELSSLRAEMRDGFDRVDRRLDLQGLMLSTSTKALCGLLENTVSLESEYKQT